MKLDRKRLVLGSAILVAAAAGHLVQNPDLLGGREPADYPVLASSAQPVSDFVLSQVTQLSATNASVDIPNTPESPKLHRISMPVAPDTPALAQPDNFGYKTHLDENRGDAVQIPGANLSPFGIECASGMDLSARASGMINIAVLATCRPNERVEVIHNDLIFSTQTSITGAIDVDVPALAGAATVLIRFEDGTVERGTVAVPDAGEYERVVLQWQGPNGAELHAYEFGAGFADDGHVHRGNPRSPDSVLNRTGGFLTTLGDDIGAQVYSYPRGQSASSDVVRISVEFPVTATNCGRDLAAKTIQPNADGRMLSTDLSLTMPGCDAIGEFLVLKNAVRDLKIASN